VAEYLFDEPLVLLAEDGGHFDEPERGVAYAVSGRCWVNNHAHVLRPKPGVDVRYLGWHLAHYDVSPYVTGSTRGKLTQAAAARMPIMQPPLPEQRRIADILDKADAIRRKRKEAIALTDELLRSAFLEMFGDPVTNPKGWDRTVLADVLLLPLRNGLSPASQGTHHGRVLTLSAITRGKFDRHSARSALFTREPPEDVSLVASDFLICRGNGNADLVGAGAFPSADDPSCTFPDTMIAARVDQARVGRHFLQLLWRSELVREHVRTTARTTNGTLKINQTAVEAAPVLLPAPRRLQQFEKFAARLVEAADSQKAFAEVADNMFASLVGRSFHQDHTSAAGNYPARAGDLR